jgi:hypothetical protein
MAVDTIPALRCLTTMTRFHDSYDSTINYSCTANDGGIKRGDRAETGDEEARPTAGAEPEDELASLGQSDLDDLTVLDAGDPSLGLTDIEGIPLGGRAKPANEGRVKTGQRRVHSGH